VITPFVAGQNYRQSCVYSGPGASSVVSAYLNGALQGSSAAGTTSAITVTSILPVALGTAATTGLSDSIVSRICVDQDQTRCR
jgi:hypothetical protein